MHLTQETILERPREVVWRVFQNPANLPRWQPTLQAIEFQKGTPGEPGSVCTLRFAEQGQTIELVETVRTRREFEEFSATYSSRHGENLVSNRFDDLDGRRTRWIFEGTFHFHGVLKLAAPFIRGVIRKRMAADAARFKALLEADELEIGP